MKTSSLFNYDMLFGDHMAKVSDKAKLYYIKLCFFANNGFVANPLSILDSMGYDKSVFHELVANEELLTLPDRCEVFITAYFVHNHLNPASWLKTPFAPYWRGKLWTKSNGVATFKPQPKKEENVGEQIINQVEEENPPEPASEPLERKEEEKPNLADFTEEELNQMSDEEFEKHLPF